jgi:hypothetical protein
LIHCCVSGIGRRGDGQPVRFVLVLCIGFIGEYAMQLYSEQYLTLLCNGRAGR